ncbi:hypothetical protein DL768_009026 [Monosporascus sp. mg162]|nr:hypothetical protein DL768_009026 [Monosporascus sp. mg162]
MAWTWTAPAEREVATTAAFISSEGRKIHDGLGGPSQFDPERAEFVPFRPYVLKSARTYVDQLAEDSVEKRNKIFNTFAVLRDALNRADPKHMSFRSNKELGDCADRLYKTVVDSIEELILLTSKEKSTWRKYIPKFKHKTPPTDPDAILQNVIDRTKEFERAVGVARDQAIENTAIMAQYIGIQTAFVHRDVNAMGSEVGEMHGLMTQMSTGMDLIASDSTYVRRGIEENAAYMKRESEQNEKRHQELRGLIIEKLKVRNAIATRETMLLEATLNAKNHLLQLLLETKRKDAQEIARLRQRAYYARERGAVVRWDRFCQILARPGSTDGEPPDLECMFQHPNEDLERTLVQRGRFNMATQGQVQSLLRHNRFLQWMNRRHPDMILVEANVRTAGLEKLSAISVFCATFVTSMISVHPDGVVAHFFCGLHTVPQDPWYGPNGLVRSIAMQVLMKLVEMNILNLNFIDNRDYLMALEEHDLDSLCETLHSLVSQFPADTTVYCIIDSISCFDKDRTFKDLEIVIKLLQRIVDDRSLIPIFKVLMTNPTQSTRRMKDLSGFKENRCGLVSLSSKNLVPMEISNRVVESHLLRPLTPTPPLPKRELFRTVKWESYSDQLDEGWQTE